MSIDRSGDSDRSKKDQVTQYFGGVSLPDFGVDARFFPAMGKRLVEFSGVARGLKVLDVACGLGASLYPAAALVGDEGNVVGIDLVESMILALEREIVKRGINNAVVQVMDAEQIGFTSASFDIVLCGFALFFMPRLHQALAEFQRVLKVAVQWQPVRSEARMSISAGMSNSWEGTDWRGKSPCLKRLRILRTYNVRSPTPVSLRLGSWKRCSTASTRMSEIGGLTSGRQRTGGRSRR